VAAVEVTHVEHVPEALDRHTVRRGLYAVFTHHGTADDFEETARFIFERWLPSSPYRLSPREFFEVLGPSYRPDDPAATEDIWIPIQVR
jgi:AraC family transcriptional regulator